MAKLLHGQTVLGSSDASFVRLDETIHLRAHTKKSRPSQYNVFWAPSVRYSQPCITNLGERKHVRIQVHSRDTRGKREYCVFPETTHNIISELQSFLLVPKVLSTVRNRVEHDNSDAGFETGHLPKMKSTNLPSRSIWPSLEKKPFASCSSVSNNGPSPPPKPRGPLQS